MSVGHGDGFFLPSLFDFLELDEKAKKTTLLRIQNLKSSKNLKYDRNALRYWTVDEASACNSKVDLDALTEACEMNVLKYVLQDTDTARLLLDESAVEKARELFRRRQYNSELLQELLAKVCAVFNSAPNSHGKYTAFVTLLSRGVWEEYRRITDEKTERSYGPLKKVIERIASGVCPQCYAEAERPIIAPSFPSEALCAYAADNGYDFKKGGAWHSGGEFFVDFSKREELNNARLQSGLLADAVLWGNHARFSVIVFLNEVEKRNSLRHAEKILLHILQELKKDDFCKKIMEMGLPLYMCRKDCVLEAARERTLRAIFARLEHCCDLSAVQNMSLLYPIDADGNVEEKCARGKEIWERFVSEYTYPHCAEQVFRFLHSGIDPLSESGATDGKLAIIFDRATLGYFERKNSRDAAFLETVSPSFFSPKNIWARLYLKVYAISLLDENETVIFSYIHRVWMDLVSWIAKQTGAQTVHQLDRSERSARFSALQSKMKEYDIEISGENSFDYITALLDLDIATEEECARFPVLEQLGDALYGLAVAELLFYRPENENIGARHNEFVSAKYQAELAKKNGFANLYLAVGAAQSYEDYETFEGVRSTYTWFGVADSKKYLADSLEMIIGALCLDKGPEVALAFAKAILQKTYPEEFPDEIRPTEENRKSDDIEMDYWGKILPSPCYYPSCEASTLYVAFEKMLYTVCVGTETKEKRDALTYRRGVIKSSDFSWCFYEYLHHGLSAVLQKYGKVLHGAYEEYAKQHPEQK